MSDYQVVNDPYETNTGSYPPAGNQPAPASAPPGWAQNPDGSWVQTGTAAPAQPTQPPAQPAPAPAPAQPTPAAGGYPQGAAAPSSYPTGQQPAQPTPAAPPVPANSGGSGGGGQSYEAKPIAKLGTQNGQPLEQLNLVMMTGYFQHMRDQQGNVKYTQSGNSTRLGFIIAEEQTWTDQAGQQQSKVVKHRCQAWNDHASTLVQVHDGTPVKIWGNLTVFYPRDDQGNITGSIVDIKVNKYEFP